MKVKEISQELLNFVAKNCYSAMNVKKSLELAELNLLLQSLQFQIAPWGQSVQVPRILIYVGLSLDDVASAESFFVYGFHSFIYDSNFSWKDAKRKAEGKKVVAIIFSSSISSIDAMLWHRAFEDADLCFHNVAIDFLDHFGELSKTANSRLTFGNTHRLLFREILIFGRFFDDVLRFVETYNKVDDEIQIKNIKYLPINKVKKKKSTNIFCGDIDKFDESILKQLKKFPESRLSSNLGRFSFLKHVKLRNNVIYDNHNAVYTRYLMTNDLARGTSYFKKEDQLQSLIRFLKSFIIGKRQKINGLTFRASVPSPAFSHWLMDNLIPFLVARLLYGNLKFLHNCELTEYQKFQLKFFGIELSEVIITKPADVLEVDDLMVVEKFYDPDPIFSFSSIHYHKLNDYLEKVFLEKLNQKHLNKIYVSRRDATRARILLNEVEIENYLVSQGFQIILGSTLSGKELVEIYSQASLIVGPLGAGLLNSIFSKSGITIIALTSPGYYEGHLSQISSLRGNSIRYLVGEEIPADDSLEGGVRNSNFYISLSKLHSTLESL